MVLVRRIFRLVLLLCWLPVIGLISLPFKLGGWNSIRRVGFCARIWGRGIAKILHLKIKVFGDPHAFRGGLIVSNHQGYLDIITHAAVFPLRFSPKSDIRSWPFLGWYLGISRPVWVDRSNKQKSKELLEEFIATMEHHIPLIIYPEGTSSDGRSGLLPFKSTPFAAIAETNLPIMPIITVFGPMPDGKTVAWHGTQELLPHAWRIMGYPEIRAEIHIMPLIYSEGRSRKELADYVHDIMERKYYEIMAAEGMMATAPEQVVGKQ
ncbi:MAG: lysophospholipid acyltransferase family protein [Victivallales bacterium]|nr:lysophospholipid acyltransferase family protein [Victivallales bacterium]